MDYKKKNNVKKYYAVKNGRKVGVYDNWDEASKQVIGYSDAMFKSFKTKEQAEKYIGVTKVKPVIEIYTAGARLMRGGSGWYYTVYNNNGCVEDETGDSEVYKSESEMELVAVAQALRSNQCYAGGEDTVLLVVRNYSTYQMLKGIKPLTCVDDYVVDTIKDMLSKFNNLVVVTVDNSKKYKPSNKADARANQLAQEAVIV